MAERRQAAPPPKQPNQPTNAELAAAIAAVLGGAIVVASVQQTIASILALGLAPARLSAEMTDEVATGIAAFIIMDIPTPEKGVTLQDPLGKAHIENLLRRAHYAINAARRVANAVRGGKAVADALSDERPYFAGHLEAQDTRLTGGEFGRAAQRRFGDNVSWIHSGKEDFRPSHKRADGKNFSISNPPVSTMGLPGTLPNCGCSIGPPNPEGGEVE